MILVLGAGAARAQPRPLPAEPVDGPGAGNVELQTSVDYARDARFTLSGLGGDLWRVGLVRIDVGLSSIADFEISGGVRDHLIIRSRTEAPLSDLLRLPNPNATGAFDDLLVGTRIRLLDGDSGTRIGVRVATRLPNAKHPSGLGQNTTDFYGSLLVDQSIAALQLVGNVGYGLLGDPLDAHRHVGSFLYSVLVSQRLFRGLSVVAAVDGRTGPLEPGLESRGIARTGFAWARRAVRMELDGTVGLTSRDGNLGAAIATSFRFHAFAP